MDANQTCPFCNSENINKFNSTITEHEFACRACGETFKKTHVGGQILKGIGALSSGFFMVFSIVRGGSGKNEEDILNE